MKNPTLRKTLYWLPRILALLMAAFISLFALDVFGEGYRLGELLLALFMHLLPTFAMLIVLAIAWRWERIGGILFIVLAGLFWWTFWSPNNVIFISLFGSLLALIGILFLVDGSYRSDLPENPVVEGATHL